MSVVFPVGPGEVEARSALEDILGQTWRNLEVAMVLNGASEAVRKSLTGVRDDRVRFFDLGEEPQLLRALDLAVRETRGAFLARMDSDDRCAPERIARTMTPLLEKEGSVASCGIELVGAQGDGMAR